MTSAYTVTHRLIPWTPASPDLPLSLGRNVRHDSRSLAYRYQADPVRTLASKLWSRHIPILDQARVGSCTGNAMDGAAGTDPIFAGLPATHLALDEAEALALYSAAEVIDGGGPYPPNDNGSTGLSVAQAAKNAGLISGYTHCLALNDFLNALMDGPVLLGSNWWDSMDHPDSSGLVTISPAAQIRGGHETLWRGIDVTSQTVFGDNSWSASWGLSGSFTMTWATLDRLLAEQGDGTVPIPANQPAPVPAPAPIPPAPAIDPDKALWAVGKPWCAATRTRPDLVTLKAALQTWKVAKGY